jgi:hypothetical protein
MNAANLTLGLAFFIYMIVVFCAVYLFGTLTLPTFLDSMAVNPNWIGYVLRFTFIILIAFHIPFIFFACKENFLVIVDEIMKRSISKSLDAKLSREAKRKLAIQ